MRQALLLLLLLLWAAPGAALEWRLSLVSEREAADAPLGLALDRAGRPVVVFVESRRQRIFLCRQRGGDFDEESLHHPTGLGGRAGEALDLAIDARDKLHVVHASLRAYQGVQLEYLTDRLGGWKLELPGSPRSFGYDARVALDPAGGVHLACRGRRPDNDLYYLTQKGGRWEVLEAETEGHAGFWIGLAMGDAYAPSGIRPATEPSSGDSARAGRRYKPFIAHARHRRSQEKGAAPPDSIHLRYVNAKGLWDDDVIPVAGPAGYGLSLALSSWEEPHLAFGGGGRLYHAARIATPTEGERADWRVEAVFEHPAPPAGDENAERADELVGWFTDLALVGGQEPGIVFTTPAGLGFAARAEGRWRVETIAEGRGAGRHCRIACDRWGGLHVVFYDPAARRVRYAYGRP